MDATRASWDIVRRGRPIATGKTPRVALTGFPAFWLDADAADTDDAEEGFVRTTGKQSLLSKIPIHTDSGFSGGYDWES